MSIKQENGQVTITEEFIRNLIAEKIPAWLEKTLSSDYSNPLKDAIDAELKAKDGAIQATVREIIANALTDPRVKELIGQTVIARLVDRGLKGN